MASRYEGDQDVVFVVVLWSSEKLIYSSLNYRAIVALVGRVLVAVGGEREEKSQPEKRV
jgi:hypothetical protein